MANAMDVLAAPAPGGRRELLSTASPPPPHPPYEFVEVKQNMNFYDAHAYCQREYPGGGLAGIYSQSQHALLKAMVAQLHANSGYPNDAGWYVGATDNNVEGTFVNMGTRDTCEPSQVCFFKDYTFGALGPCTFGPLRVLEGMTVRDGNLHHVRRVRRGSNRC